MKPNISLGRIFGITVGLHYSWLLIALMIVTSLAGQFTASHADWSSQAVWALAALTAIFFFATLMAHEMSHALVARARGIATRSITLFALGGVASIEKEPEDATTEFLVAVAGPVTSVLIGVVCLLAARLQGWDAGAAETPLGAMLGWLGYINLTLAAFNMIPGFPLDGGRILRAILWWILKSGERATRIASRIGQGVAVCFIALGIYRGFSGEGIGGLWIALIGWFLWQAAGSTRRQTDLSAALKTLRVSDLMARDCVSVDANENLQKFLDEQMLPSGQRCFWVEERGVIAGLVTPSEVAAVERSIWPFKTVGDVMRPLDGEHSVSPSTPVLEALDAMGRDDVNQLPVISGGRLEGIISRSIILQFFQTKAPFSGRI